MAISDKKLKAAIKQACEPPAPKNKEVFLRQFREPLGGYGDFIISQAGYIKKRMAAMSFLVFILCLMWSLLSDRVSSAVLSAFMPFLILFSAMEISRSSSYSMAELEMSCRYCLADVILARCFILGALQLLSVILLIALRAHKCGDGLMASALYILTPYMLSLALSMAALRKTGAKNSYVPVVLCCFVSLGCILSAYSFPWIFSREYAQGWWMALAGLCLLAVYEITRHKRKLVHNEWNMSLTD